MQFNMESTPRNGPFRAVKLRQRKRGPWAIAPAVVTLLLAGSAPVLAGGGEDAAEEGRLDRLVSARLEKRLRLEPYRVSDLERRVRAYEKRPLWEKLTVKGYRGFGLRVGGMPSGSGFAFGGGFTTNPELWDFRFSTDALYSTRNYKLLETRFEMPLHRADNSVTLFAGAGYNDFTRINFFGLGPGSSETRNMRFRSETRSVEAGGRYRPGRFVELEGAVGLLDTHLGLSPDSLESETAVTAVPGFAEAPDYLRTRGRVRFDLLDDSYPAAGVSVALEAARFSDRDTDRFNFTRLGAELRVYLPLGYRSRRLAFRFRTSHSLADAGREVPFHAMETLGGAETLRGFREYRFRDTRLLLMNLEYRWEVWSYADFALFTDAGKVFNRAADFDLSNLESAYGFGMRFHLPDGIGFRVDLARSNEGFRVHVGSGVRF